MIYDGFVGMLSQNYFFVYFKTFSENIGHIFYHNIPEGLYLSVINHPPWLRQHLHDLHIPYCLQFSGPQWSGLAQNKFQHTFMREGPFFVHLWVILQQHSLTLQRKIAFFVNSIFLYLLSRINDTSLLRMTYSLITTLIRGRFKRIVF